MGVSKFLLSFLILSSLAVPRAHAIIIQGGAFSALTSTDPNTSQWSGSSLSGLAFFNNQSAGDSCSGAFFESSLSYIITAAHCIGSPGSAYVPNSGSYVQLPGTSYQSAIANVFVDPGFSYQSNGTPVDDLAIIQLSTPAPSGTAYYPIYTGSDTSLIGQEFLLAGFGDAGTGVSGDICSNSNTAYCYNAKIAREGNNAFAFDSSSSNANVQTLFAGTTDLFYDLQAPNGSYNIFKSGGLPYTSSVTNEASIGLGDSGGPSLVNVNGTLEIAGIHSFAGCLGSSLNSGCADSYSSTFDFGYGSFAADTDVSLFTNFIDTSIGVTATPEPGTFGALGVGLAALGFWQRKRKQPQAEL